MSSQRVLVTGTGAVCGAGMNPGAILDAVREGRSAIAPITQWDTTGWPCRVAAEIPDFNPRALVDDRKLHKLIRRTDLVGLYAAGSALTSAGVLAHRESLDETSTAAYNDRTGVYVGSGAGNFSNQYDYFQLMTDAKGDLITFGRELSNTVNPMWLLRTLSNNVLGHIGIKYTLKGANACITNHSVGGILAVIEAAEALRTGEADRAVAVGHDAPIEPQMVIYYHRLGLLASDALLPFDSRRDGSLFGEGAGALFLETEASASSRKAPVLGEYLGGGHACEAEGLITIRDDGDGVARAIAQALDDAGIAAADVGMIVAHGNGVWQSDMSECAAISAVFRLEAAARHGIQVGARTPDCRSGHPRDDDRACRAQGRYRAGYRDLVATRSRLHRRAHLHQSARAPQQRGADHLPRICRHRRCAAGPRGLTPQARMADAAAAPGRCGIDSVEIARIERLLAQTPADGLTRFWSEQELADAGDGPGRAASLAARFAAKEACAKLFPRETALGQVVPEDFSIAHDNYGAPQIVAAPNAKAAMERHRIGRIALSLTHDRVSASAVALAEPAVAAVPLAGRILYRFFPIRRDVILANLKRVYGDAVASEEIVRLAQAHYGHLWRLFGEFLKFRWLSQARKAALVRVENIEALVAAVGQGKGVLVLTGHFGNREVATIAGIGNYPEVRGRFHFVRRAIKPKWLDALVTRRFNKAGFGVLPKRGCSMRFSRHSPRGT